MAEDTPQRAYRAACPGCGAPIEFRSAQSTHAVCPYCQSTVVRSGETLARVGKMAEVFNDFSPLQLQAAGVFEGQPFTVLGRLQYHYAQGTWTEWHVLLDNGSSAFLSEDNGAYVFTLPASTARELPPADKFRIGANTAINGKTFTVASSEAVSLLAAQGELPSLPALGQPFAMVELRSADGEVLSIDYGPTLAGGVPVLSRGRAVQLDDLQLTGLKAESAKDEKGGQQFNCPHCGGPVTLKLASSKSITCPACKSLIDLSQGVGAALKSALQDAPVSLLIALGSVGQLQGASWQVVGFQHRKGHEPDDEDEGFEWDEYLLYNRKLGFSFLVDSEDGWSLVKPVTGAPVYKKGSNSATYLATTYPLLSSYAAETTYVAGEFYWQVTRGQKTFNRDFASAKGLLSLEQTPTEVTWSIGNKIDSNTVATAFGLEDKKDMLRRQDVKPFSAAPQISLRTIIIVVVVIVLVLMLLGTCSGGSGGGYRSSGGSYGGYSSGGGHK